MGKIINLLNKKFSLLSVVEESLPDSYGRKKYICFCDCGTITKGIAARHLMSGATKSCGCLKKITSVVNGVNSKSKISGNKSYLWNPKLTNEERLSRRNLPEVIAWRKKVFCKDNYKCVVCQSSTNLNAHHLNSWHSTKIDRFSVDNGRTLCETCHKEYHKSNGGLRKPCTKEHFAIWYLERTLKK